MERDLPKEAVGLVALSLQFSPVSRFQSSFPFPHPKERRGKNGQSEKGERVQELPAGTACRGAQRGQQESDSSCRKSVCLRNEMLRMSPWGCKKGASWRLEVKQISKSEGGKRPSLSGGLGNVQGYQGD